MKTKPLSPTTGAPRGVSEERWNAVLRRDPKAEGKFYYAVVTTGVYCRPTCASRRAKRENVRFFASCAEAEAAGFRPCQRCQPRALGLGDGHAAKVLEACRRIEASDTPPSLDTLARAAGLSRFHFHRVFTRVTGVTPKAYTKAHRATRVRQTLRDRATVTEAIYEAGFNSNGRFYAESSRLLGMTPKKFSQGAPGETIRFTIAPCSLGFVLVATSAKGICAIALGDSKAKLAGELPALFPEAHLMPGERELRGVVAKVVRLVERPRLGLDLPLDVRGTIFQQKVWAALVEIPLGSTTSYSEIARRIGTPRAVRAVAGAVASNNLALAIPCHRVVRADGDLCGYRWGPKRKRALIEREQALDQPSTT